MMIKVSVFYHPDDGPVTKRQALDKILDDMAELNDLRMSEMELLPTSLAPRERYIVVNVQLMQRAIEGLDIRFRD